MQVSSEILFTIRELTVSARRKALSAEHVEQQVFIHDNIK